MDLKGTRTERNIKAALAGESIARNKYTYFADQARKEGDQELAAMFERMAGNESIHARIWYTTLHGAIQGNAENLRNAAAGEFQEWSDMYPEFAAIAREEGFEDLANMFERIAEIEKSHEKQFMEALVKFSKKAKTQEAPAASVQEIEPEYEDEDEDEDDEPQVKDGYRCTFCGAVHETRLDVCPVCQAIGAFEPCKIFV